MKKRLNSVFNYILCYIKEEYKFLIGVIICYIVFLCPVNYYIIIGGGISDIGSRVKVVDQYDSKGSLNISYVEEIKGKVGTFLLSYVLPDWEAVSVNDYKYTVTESIEDIDFRNDIDLKKANDNAIMWAYKLADKTFEVKDTRIYVIMISEGYDNKLKVQDEILSINDHTYDNVLDYRDYLQQLDITDTVKVKVRRDNEEVVLDCNLYESEGVKVLGIVLSSVNDYVTDPKVTIKFRDSESGPSGGLITTLAIYNKLVPEDITKSLKIAGTGTIEEDGSIEQIGGVKYKLLGASKKGADVFLVPSGDNYEECMKIKEEKELSIKVIGVSNIEEAINKLKNM